MAEPKEIKDPAKMTLVEAASANCAAVNEILEAKSAEKKVPAVLKQTPTGWNGCVLKVELPAKFVWKGKEYVAAELSEIELNNLAEDPKFRNIQKKE